MFILVSFVLLWLIVGGGKTSDGQWHVMPFNTNAILPLRGILALMIVFHHFPVFYPENYACINVADGWGGSICSLFFLFSGYGLTKSYLIKGDLYLKGFLFKRLLKIALPAALVLGAHFIVQFVVWGCDYDLLILDVTNILPLLPHYWFIYTLFIFYLIFYLSFKVFRNAMYGAVIICIATVIYHYITKDILHFTENWWNSIHGIAFGSIIANIEPKVKPWIEDNKTMYRLFVIFNIFMVCIYNTIGCYLFYLPAWGTVFFLLLPFMLYLCNSLAPLSQCRVLNFFGGISLEIYLVHKSVMDLLHPIVISASVFFVSVILLSILFAWILKNVTCYCNIHIVRG